MKTINLNEVEQTSFALATRPKNITQPKAVGFMAIAFAFSYVIGTYILNVVFSYPTITKESGDIALPLFQQGIIWILLGFALLILGSGLLIALSLALSKILKEPYLKILGLAGGIVQIMGYCSWFLLVPFLTPGSGYDIFRQFILLANGVIVPLVLAWWTLTLATRLPKGHRFYKSLGFVAVFGLLLGAAKSFAWLWGLNLAADEPKTFDLEVLLNLIYLFAESLWLVWLILIGFRVRHLHNGAQGAVK